MTIISTDSKYLFNIQSYRIKVESILSGETVFNLNYDNKIVDSICINPLNKYQLLSFHNDGAICLWDYEDGVLLKTYNTKLNVKKVFANHQKQCLYALTTQLDNTNDTYSFYRFDFNATNTNEYVNSKLLIENVDLNDHKLQIDINSNAKYIAFIQKRKKLVVIHLKKNIVRKYTSKHELTCLTIHPNEDCIATGTTKGKIILWYGFLSDSNKETTTKSILHWHALPVLSLCFTQEGSYLLSGGHECVLVKWMYKTGQKDFKPRLGSPITQITCSNDNTIYGLDHADNSLHIIGSNLSIIQTFSAFITPYLAQSQLNPFPSGLNYFKRLNCLITNSKPGHLQFFTPNQEKLLFNLDIVEENYISPENLRRPRIHNEIEHVAISNDGNWLATVERRDDQVTTPDVKLKFWYFDTTTNKFTLNTLVRYPHSYDKVNKIKFKKNENLMISCGSDGCFKTWLLADNNSPIQNTQNELKLASSWLYDSCNGYRSMIPNDADFNDKNYAAVVFNHVITVWNCDNYMEFVSDLVHCDPLDEINNILFGSNEYSNYLIASHKNYLNIWNIDENRCISSQKLSLTYLTTHPIDKSLVIGFILTNIKDELNNLKIITFKPNDKKISNVLEEKVLLNEKFDVICLRKSNENLDLVTSDSEKKSILNEIDIFYCDNKQKLQRINVLDDINNNNTIDDQAKLTRLQKNLPINNLTALLNQHKSKQFIDINKKLIEYKKIEENLKKIDLTPAYLLPKVSTFCYDTLKSMLDPVNTSANENDIEMKEVKVNGDKNGEAYSEDDEDEVMDTDIKKPVNGINKVINGYGNHNGGISSDDDDDDDDSYEVKYQIDKNNKNKLKNNLKPTTTTPTNNAIYDNYTNINDMILKNYKFEDFLIKLSK